MRIMDYDMRERAVEELHKLGDTPTEIARKIGCAPPCVRVWLSQEGIPSAYYLKRLHELGCDILYIITGERGNCNEHI